MSFDYEQSIWGRGAAGLSPTDPASFRLKQSLKAIKNVVSGGKVLEVGCGAGQFIRAVKRERPDLICHGCDISTNAIEIAQVQDNVVYAVSGASLPYEDRTMDAVLVYDVLEHVEDAMGLLREVFRVLKPGGVFYAYVPCEGDALSLWNWCRRFGWKGDLTLKYAGHINYFSRTSLKLLLQQAQFSRIKFTYSEHVLGQMLGFVAFNMLDRAAKKAGMEQINGEEFFEEMEEESSAPGLLGFLKDSVNSLVYFESWLLQLVPSPNVHAVVIKE